MSALYSNRLEKRNFELEFDHKYGTNDFPEMGEITGDQFIYNDIDKGMPVRGNFITNKNDKKNILDNIKSDFDLYEKKSNLNINYYDPFGIENKNSLVHIDNYKEPNTILSNNIEKTSNNIDEYGYFLFDNIQKYLLKNHYLIGSYFLNIILSTFYIASKNKTLIELKNYLNLGDKQNTLGDINIFMEEIQKIKYININNFIIIPYEFKLNKTFLNYTNSIKIINYENKYSNLSDECIKINKYISNCHNYDFENTLKPHNIKENSIISLISGTIEPIWESNFDEIINDTFFSFKKRNQNYLLANNKNFYYTVHDDLELIELKTYDKKMSFGIILSNGDYFPKISSELLNFMIGNLELTKFKYLIIPQIKENLKLRYTNILKESGLHKIFQNIDIPDLISTNNIYLNDIVQNIVLSINKNKNSYKLPITNNIKNTVAKKINTPFIYYLRLNTLNTMLCMGQYC